MHIIGLTGGSGTGKSTVSEMFRQKGAGVVNADVVYHRLCSENQEMLAELAKAFGSIVTKDGNLNRPALAKIVFSDAEKLERLNRITLPYIRQASIEEIKAQCQREIVLYDAPTLFETGADTLCEDVIAVLAPKEMRISRIVARDKITQEAARARIEAQPTDAFYHAKCRWILQNDSDLETLQSKVDAVWVQLTQR